MINDSGFADWLASDYRQPIWSMELHAFDGSTEKVLYTSDRDYLHPDYTFYGVMTTPSIRQSLSKSVVADYSEIGIGDLTLIDLLSELDAWRTYRHAAVTLRLGDRRWSYDQHRVMMNATVGSWKSDGALHQIKLRDNQAQADKLISYAEITTKTGAAGVLVRGLMIDSGAFVSGDIDTASFNAIDSEFPYSFTIGSFDGQLNVLDVADKVLAGLPVDYGVNINNKLEAVILDKPNASTFIDVVLLDKPVIGDALYPLSKLTLTNSAYADVVNTNSTIQSNFGANARQESIAIAVNNSAHANALATKRASLFNQVIDPIQLRVEQKNIKLGETIKFSYQDLGFNSGQLAVVTDIEISDAETMKLEVAVWR